MFSGIVEATAVIEDIQSSGTNKVFTISNPFGNEIYIDQSISHNGVCLTITEIVNNSYKLDAIEETLKRSNLGSLQLGDQVNLERSLKLNDRLDGHMVQGHVDCTGTINVVEDKNGSWEFTISFPERFKNLIIEKGSICVNGISLTVSFIENDVFKVSIIPYTYQHTNLKHLSRGSIVNIEFDSIGKYVMKYLEKINS